MVKHFTVGDGPNAWTVSSIEGKLGPSELSWTELGVDFVLESSGVYKSAQVLDSEKKVVKEGYDGHITAGAKKVILAVPAADNNQCTLVLGVNDEDLTPAITVVSVASGTINCLAPIAKIINDNFKIKNGFMTTVHAYTNDQKVADNMHPDLRKSRAAGINIIPTSTSAAITLPIIIHSLPPRCLEGLALMVPCITGSLVDLTVNVQAQVTAEQVNAAVKTASETASLASILKYTEDELVSSDIIHDTHSSIFDAKSTKVIPNPSGGTILKVISWYDNEWMYSCRCADLFIKLSKI